MHGIIFAELKKYVIARHGGAAWNHLLQEASMGGKVFLPGQTYGDDDAKRLVAAAAKATGTSDREIMHDFGRFIAPDLYKMYNAQINPAWRSLDLIEHTEEMIHRQVRLKTPGAEPPRIVCRRENPDRVVIEYTSARKMCDVAKGIAEGIGEHYGETLEVSERSCMIEGDAKCDIVVSLATAALSA